MLHVRLQQKPSSVRGGFTLIEVLIVAGIAALIASLLFPIVLQRRESARIQRAKAEFRALQAALDQYRQRFGAFPPSKGTSDNPGSETLLQCLLTPQNGGPFLNPNEIRRYTGDTDADDRKELVDPWGNPWIYFNASDYSHEPAIYVIGNRRWEVGAAKMSQAFANPGTYQLWGCGENQTDEDGQGDDISNIPVPAAPSAVISP